MTDSDDIPRDGKVLYRFRSDPGNKNRVHDIADEYIVLAVPDAFSGLIIYGRMDNDPRGWIANWSAREVVRSLLAERDDLELHLVTLADSVERLVRENLKSPWIPVAERVPERGVTVLAWAVLRGHGIAVPAYQNGYSWHLMGTVGDVTHWMPMPEGPK